MAYDFSFEHFEGNTLKYKLYARNIRWVNNDSIYRLTDYFKRSFSNDNQIIESKKLVDTLFSFKINELSTLNYMAETQNFFELNKFIKQEKESGSPLINAHLLVRHKRWSLPFSTFILTLLAVSSSSFKRREGMGVNLAFGIITAFTFVFFDKFFYFFFRFFKINAQDDKIIIIQFFMQVFNIRHFIYAVRAPGGPEIYKYNFPF